MNQQIVVRKGVRYGATPQSVVVLRMRRGVIEKNVED